MTSQGKPADVVRAAEKILGITFRNPTLLEQALVHRSYLNENPEFHLGSNERLEYLGDAVIGMVTSEYLYHAFPDASEGLLTAMRAALVKAQTLGRIARGLGIGTLLFLSRGEVDAGGRTRRRLLAQALEAIIGAIYLDQGLTAARDFSLRLLGPDAERLVREQSYVDAKSELQQVTQAAIGERPIYEVVSATGPGHRPHFVVEVRLGGRVIGTGEGNQKQEAEQAAARQALKSWQPPSRPEC